MTIFIYAYTFKVFICRSQRYIQLIFWIATPKFKNPLSYMYNGLISYNTVVLYSRDRYEIIGLRKSSHSIKQPCSSICLKKAFAMHQSC